MDGTVTLDSDGVLRLRWNPGIHISEQAALDAMALVNTLSGENRYPMIVYMATTASVHRKARAVFGKPCAASAIALLGASPVDRVIANFILGVSTLPCPTRFFTSEDEAEQWIAGSVGVAEL
jgi:hypothetical protein